ncbi:hypothetical protein PQX77_017775 [Marasmius sp. AFHP31]|nr:hypothetical protein PQX77_017775 [Marasmius sp. AFHP31]
MQASAVVKGKGRSARNTRTTPSYTSSGPSRKQVLVLFPRGGETPSLNLSLVTATPHLAEEHRSSPATASTQDDDIVETWQKLIGKEGTIQQKAQIRIPLVDAAGKKKGEKKVSVHVGDSIFVQNDPYGEAVKNEEEDLRAMGSKKAQKFFRKIATREVFQTEITGYVWEEAVLDLARVVQFKSSDSIWIPCLQWFTMYCLEEKSRGVMQPVALFDVQEDREEEDVDDYNPDINTQVLCSDCNTWYDVVELSVASEERPVGSTPVERFLLGPIIRGGGWQERFGEPIQEKCDWWLFSGTIAFQDLVKKKTNGSGEWPDLAVEDNPELFGEFADQGSPPHRLPDNVVTCRDRISTYRKCHICPDCKGYVLGIGLETVVYLWQYKKYFINFCTCFNEKTTLKGPPKAKGPS